MEFSKSLLETAAYIHAGVDKMPDTALFTEEAFEIDEIAVFAAVQTAVDMFGKFIVGKIGDKTVLYRKINKSDNNIFYRDLIRCLKIKNVIVVINANPLEKQTAGFAEIRDFIRFGIAIETGKNRMWKNDGGIYAAVNGEPTEAEKRMLVQFGADAFGENTLPLVMMNENISLRAIMMFERGNADELEI